MRIITFVNKFIFVFIFVFFVNINSSHVIAALVERYPIEQIIKEKTVTVDLKAKTIVSILSEIQKQSGVNYGFSKGIDPKTMGTFSLSVENTSVEQALNQLFTSTKYTYKVTDNMISIITKTPVKNGITSSQQQTIVTLSGKVIDDISGAPVVGATVIVSGTANGGITDEKGAFSIKTAIGSILEVSCTGMEELKYTITKAETNLILKMKISAMAVDDVVVTGFFDRKKTGYAGTVTTIKKEDLQKVSTGNIFTTISTLDAGFKINENNLTGSNPNVIPDFTIRGKGSFQNGSTSPIFILDGFEVSSTKIFDMDINRIESITLLKDASATILYGSRASNGVIVIETTAPKAGQLRVTYDFKPTIGIVDLTGYDLMNAKEKLEYERLAGLYDHTENLYTNYTTDQKYYNRYKNVLEGVDTYWLSQPTQTSFSQSHSLFVEGGVDNVRYGIDAAYNGNSGVMKKSGRDRTNLGFSLLYRIKDKVTIKNYISYAYTNAYNSPYGSFSTYGVLNPYERIRDDENNLLPILSNDAVNPLYDANLPNRSGSNSQEFSEQFNIDWTITEGLRLRGQFGIMKSNSNSDNYTSPLSSKYVIIKYDTEDGGDSDFLPMDKRGELSVGKGDDLQLSSNFTLNYNTSFAGKHILYSGIGAELTTSNSTSSNYTLTGFPDDRYSDPAFAMRFKEDSKAGSSESSARSVGFFGNVNYIFDDRFFADLSFRYDGSSRFGSDNKFAPFWSVGTGWNIHNEKSWFKSNTIDMLKLRVSYGVTGNQEFSDYQAKTMYKFNVNRFYQSIITSSLMGYGNPDLKWQNQYQTNIGFDFGLNQGRVRASINYYNKITDGMLTSVTVAPSLGLISNSFTSNLGKIKNTGAELNLNIVAVRNIKKDLEWSFLFQGAHNKNKLLEISNQLKNINASNNLNKKVPNNVYEEGESMSAIKAVRSLGIDPVTGQEVFLKKNGNISYTWDANDKILAGDTEPKVFGNLGTNLFYKGWNLNASFRYSFGADYYNQTLSDRVEGADPANNADRRVLNDRWKTPGQNALYRNIKDYKSSFISTRFIQKENLFQLSSLSLSYDFSKELLSKYKINTFRLSFYANDIFRASTVKTERGLAYPFQQSYVFGLNIGF